MGLALGYMVTYSELDVYFNFSSERATDWEQSYLLSWTKKVPGFVTVDTAQMYTYELEAQMKPADIIGNRDNMLLTSEEEQIKEVTSDVPSEVPLEESQVSGEGEKGASNDESSEYVTVYPVLIA
eukprot:TRINITY_DN3475_c0_g1_i31.p1 TRINITY_DN3475_c0_g1~~TRINITY_DN3475_c0_g1_i31.p1  ORF type:complete len:125 (-),score=36.43 TRINITY_DN3475_c0_g1_i31:181-555(-)